MKTQIVNRLLSIMMLVVIMMIVSNVSAQRRRIIEPRKPLAVEEYNKQSESEKGDYFDLPGITPEQKEQIDELRLQNMKNTRQLRNKLFEKRAHLQTISDADNPDSVAINKTIDEIAGIRAEIEKGHMATHLSIRNLLTGDQKLVFDNRRFPCRRFETRHDRFPEGRGPGLREDCPFRR